MRARVHGSMLVSHVKHDDKRASASTWRSRQMVDIASPWDAKDTLAVRNGRPLISTANETTHGG